MPVTEWPVPPSLYHAVKAEAVRLSVYPVDQMYNAGIRLPTPESARYYLDQINEHTEYLRREAGTEDWYQYLQKEVAKKQKEIAK